MRDVVDFARTYPSKVAAILLVAPMPLGIATLVSGQAGIPEGGGGVVLTVLLILALALFVYIAYRLWARPSRRLILIIGIWTAAAAAWAVSLDGLYWQLVLDVAFLAACFFAWNEDRVVHRATGTTQPDAARRPDLT